MTHHFAPILILLLSSLFHPLRATTFNGYQIRDLYTNDDTFITDSETWTATILRHDIPYSVCNGIYLMGGYDVLGVPNMNIGVQGFYFEKTYYDLPPHNIIYYSINLWLIDSWDDNPPDYFQLQFDSTLVEGWNVYYMNFQSHICGNPSWYELPNMIIFGKVSHTDDSLTLRIISQLDSWATDESLGFRDINMIFTNSAETSVNEICGLSPIPLPTNQCTCLFGQYFRTVAPIGCDVCDPSCSSCFGPSSSECYVCNAGYSFVESECILCDASCADCFGPEKDQCSSCGTGKSLFDNRVCVDNCAVTSDFGTVCVNPCLSNQVFYLVNLTCGDDCHFPYVTEPVSSGAQVCINQNDAHGWIYWDGTWNSLCPAPLEKAEVNDKLYCLYNCQLSEYLYWDGTCQITCENGLISSTLKNRQFCQHPCVDLDDYIYWNGTCGGPCELPLKNFTDGKANYCKLPCSEGQFWDGAACLDSCNYPLRAREAEGILYCERPCPSSQYFYWNGSCLDTCDWPYKADSSQGNDMKFCCYLCDHYDEYYYPRRGECLPHCDSSKVAEVIIVDVENWYVACRNPNETIMGQKIEGESEVIGPLYYPITAIKVSSEKVAGAFIAVDIVVSLLRDSHVMILILTRKILECVRYIDIQFPPQLVQDFGSYNPNHFYLNFGPGMGQQMEDKFTNSSLPMVFERAGLHSRFLVNFFKPITSFLIMSGLIAWTMILRKFLQRKVLAQMILRRFEIFLRWNLAALLVICNIDEITLYGILEWKTFRTGSGLDSLSLLISLGMAVLSLAVFVAPFYLLDRINQTRFRVLSNQANEVYFNLLRKIEVVQLLWKDFKDGPQKAFLSLYIFRIALIYMIIALLYKMPVLQTVLIFLLSLGMLVYMIMVKPFMKKLDYIQSLIYEICMLISMGSTLILTVFDYTEVRADQVWLFLGDCIMFCNIFISGTAVIFFVLKFLLELERVWKFYKTAEKPASLVRFCIQFLKEDDPIIQELKRNKRTSGRLDLTTLERGIERRNFERYNIKQAPEETRLQQDEVQSDFVPRKDRLRIRRSLFNTKTPSSDSESSPIKINSTLDGDKSPSTAATPSNENENIRLSNKIKIFNEIRKDIQDPPCRLQAENEEKSERKDEISDEKDEANPLNKRKFLFNCLETIKEMESMEISEIKNTLHTKRFGNVMEETARGGDLSFLSAINKRLSSETKMQKPEEMDIIKEEVVRIKKRFTTKREPISGDSPLFQ